MFARRAAVRPVSQLVVLCSRKHSYRKICELFRRSHSGRARLDDLRERLRTEEPFQVNDAFASRPEREHAGTKRPRKRSADIHVAAAVQRLAASHSEEFWRKTTVAFKDVPAELFLSPAWQQRFSVSGNDMLREFLSAEITAAGGFADVFCEDVMRSLEFRPMKVKLTPYVLSRIDWSQPTTDPLRRQFIPMQVRALSSCENCQNFTRARHPAPITATSHPRYPLRVCCDLNVVPVCLVV